MSRTSTKRTIAAGSALAVAITLGLAGCAEYSPLTPQTDDQATTPPPRDSRDGRSGSERPPTGDDAESDDPATDAQTPDAAPPVTEPPGSAPPVVAPRTPTSRQQRPPTRTGTTTRASGTNPTGSSSSSTPPPPIGESYRWKLPVSDTSVNNFLDGEAYGWLANGDCDRAAAYIAPDKIIDDSFFPPYTMRTPRYVVFVAAGVAMCRGVVEEARERYTYALTTWGTQGLDRPTHPYIGGDPTRPVQPPARRGYGEPECDLYRTLSSVLLNIDPASLSCPGGARPVFTYRIYTLVPDVAQPGVPAPTILIWDDPLTAEDESAVPPATWDQTPVVQQETEQELPLIGGDPEDEFGELPPPAAAVAQATALPASTSSESGSVAADGTVPLTPEEPASPQDTVEPGGSDAGVGDTPAVVVETVIVDSVDEYDEETTAAATVSEEIVAPVG